MFHFLCTGVFRDGCTDRNSKWQGYFCGGNDWQYRVLIIESLDNDTETRTGAPLTVLGWTVDGAGVVDLVSGPNYKEVTDWTSDPITDKTYKIATYHAVVALGMLIVSKTYFRSFFNLNSSERKSASLI